MALITAPNLENADASYAVLIAAHEGLTDAESQALNARLILVLINQIGNAAIIEQAVGLAKHPVRKGDDSVR